MIFVFQKQLDRYVPRYLELAEQEPQGLRGVINQIPVPADKSAGI